MAVKIVVSYIFLIVIAVALVALSIYSALYFFLYYADNTETWKTLWPRIICIISLVLVVFTPLAIPLDVSITTLSPQLTFMDIIWQVIAYLNIALSLLVLPYTLFVVDSKIVEEKGCFKSHFNAIWQTFILLIIVLAICLILWVIMGNADVPLKKNNGARSDNGIDGYTDLPISDLVSINFVEKSAPSAIRLTLKMSAVSYIIAIITFMGTFLFIIFTGIGLAALPVDYIKVFFNRPHQMTINQLLDFKKKYSSASLKLINQIDEVYEKLISAKPRHLVSQSLRIQDYRTAFSGQRQLEKKAAALERRAVELNMRYQEIIAMNSKKTANPLKYYGYLVLGVVTSLLSLVIEVQIAFLIVWQLKPAALWHDEEIAFFLATMLYKAQQATGVPIISALLFAAIAFYFMCCFLKGVAKFGFRFILLVSIHPMRKHATTISSMLFNCILCLLGTITSLNFFTTLFYNFTYGSSAGLLFNKTINNIQYIRYWFEWQWAILAGIVIVSLILSLVVKSQDAADVIFTEADKVKEDIRQIKLQQKIRAQQQKPSKKENQKIIKQMKSTKVDA